MFWIALSPTHDDERVAWGWRALQFTPRVAHLDEAIVLEVSASERLWGGRRKLLRELFKPQEGLTQPGWGHGGSALVALARLRLKRDGKDATQPDDFPLDVLTAAQKHAPILERIGCRTWGQLRALPRGGLSRRFGAELLAALDRAFGQQPESHAWITLPDSFDVNVELVSLATSAPELMWAGQRLLTQMQMWLQARNLGVLALELEWTIDLRRLDGKILPPKEQLAIRTAQPTQDMVHLRRLVSEHLSRTTIAAPANHLRLRSLETVAWGGVTTSLLPDESRQGEKLHQLVERLSVRLGDQNVLVARAKEDHRPECMQEWVGAKNIPLTPTLSRKREREKEASPSAILPLPAGERAGVRGIDCVYPTWLLPAPIELAVTNSRPHYHGPLRRLTRLYRVETAWWEEGGPALRDYFIARSEEMGLVWIYRERTGVGSGARWFLQGLYA